MEACQNSDVLSMEYNSKINYAGNKKTEVSPNRPDGTS